MTLLDEVIEASGGMARWNSLRRFTLQLSLGGTLFSPLCRADCLKEVVAEGSTGSQSVRFIGFARSTNCAFYQPDSVTIESVEGKTLRTWQNPLKAFSDRSTDGRWDELQLVFFCGFSVWNFLTTPFLLAHPDVRVEELPPQREQAQLWRRLQAVFPPSITTHSSSQMFYFDEQALQRRTDHDLLGVKVAHYSWAHQVFSGIMVPTLRRSLPLRSDGTVTPGPSLLDVEVFDASFE